QLRFRSHVQLAGSARARRTAQNGRRLSRRNRDARGGRSAVSRSDWSRRQRWKNDAIHFAARSAIDLGLFVPRSWLSLIGEALGRAAHALLADARRRTRANL